MPTFSIHRKPPTSTTTGALVLVETIDEAAAEYVRLASQGPGSTRPSDGDTIYVVEVRGSVTDAQAYRVEHDGDGRLTPVPIV